MLLKIITDTNYNLYFEDYSISENGYICNGTEYQFTAGFIFEEVDGLEYISNLKALRFTILLTNAEESLRSFQFEGLTFESSGESKSNLMFVQSQLQSNPTLSIPWLALNGTYQLGEQNLIMIDATNIGAFAEAMKLKNEQVFVWQLTQQNALEMATTIEEVDAVDVEYHD